jgi:hypothetical protein
MMLSVPRASAVVAEYLNRNAQRAQ